MLSFNMKILCAVLICLLSCMPVQAQVFQNSSGPALPVACDKSVNFSAISATTLEISASGTTRIYICGFYVQSNAATLHAVNLVTSASSSCSSPTTIASLGLPAVTDAVASYGQGLGTIVAPIASATFVCVSFSAVVSTTGTILFAQF